MFDTSWIGPAISSLDTARSNVWRVQEARHAERYSAHMAGTAYQRGMADMKAAGLNPILAFDQGGAMAPQGVAANIQDTDISGAISTALQTKRLSEELNNMRMTGHEIQSRINKNIVDADKAGEERELVKVQKILAETQIAGAKNVEQAERSLGSDPALVRKILEIIRLFRSPK